MGTACFEGWGVAIATDLAGFGDTGFGVAMGPGAGCRGSTIGSTSMKSTEGDWVCTVTCDRKLSRIVQNARPCSRIEPRTIAIHNRGGSEWRCWRKGWVEARGLIGGMILVRGLARSEAVFSYDGIFRWDATNRISPREVILFSTTGLRLNPGHLNPYSLDETGVNFWNFGTTTKGDRGVQFIAQQLQNMADSSFSPNG